MNKSLMKIWSIALCAMAFVACSTTEDPTENGGGQGGFTPDADAEISVEECPVQSAKGGTVTLQYYIAQPIEGEMLTASEPNDSWISNILIGEKVLTFDVAMNAEAGTEERVAWFDLTYGRYESVRVMVRQQSEASLFDVAFANATPESVTVTVTPHNNDITYIVLKGTRPYISETDDLAYYALSYALYLHDYYGEDYLDDALHTGVYTEENMSWARSEVQPVVCVYGITRADDAKRTPSLATAVTVVDAPLLPYPQIVLEASAAPAPFTVAAGTSSFACEIIDPLPGRELQFELSQEASGWVHDVTYSDGRVTFAYDANIYGVERHGAINLVYDYATTVSYSFSQVAETSSEQVSFTVEIVETHWDNIVVNCVPSNLSTPYVIGAISKAQFEKYPCYGDKTLLPTYDFEYLYYKPQVLTGAQQNYKQAADIGYNNEYVDHYLYVYAVDAAATMAVSDIQIYEVKLVDDRPEIHFRDNANITYSGSTPQIVVPAAGAEHTVKYGVDNPYPQGHMVVSSYSDIFVKEEGSSKVKFVVDQVNQTVTFWTVDNAKSKDVYGNISFEYYSSPEDKSSKDTATLSILQRAK